MPNRILIVDDERPITELLSIVLHREGFDSVRAAHTGADALAALAEEPPDLMILDVGLPDTDGFTLAGRIRELTDAPILFLTARDSDLDKLMGFGVGGDDYVTKPFNPLEVVARVKAHLRRVGDGRGNSDHAPAHECGRFRLDEDAGRLEVDGTEVAIPAREFQLLAFLCRSLGRVFSKRQLYEQVWGDPALGESDDATVMVHVRRIREKIEVDAGDPRHLLTVRGLGYKLVIPAEDTAPLPRQTGDPS